MGSGLSGSSGCHTVACLVDQILESRIQADGSDDAEQSDEEPNLLGNYEGGGVIPAAGVGVGSVTAGQPEESSVDYQAGGSVGGGFGHLIPSASSLFVQPQDWLSCLDGLADLDKDLLLSDLDLHHVPAIVSADALAALLGDGSGGEDGGGGGSPLLRPRDRDASSADVQVATAALSPAPRDGSDDLVE